MTAIAFSTPLTGNIFLFISKDYISSIFVMVPQIEGILRALLTAKGLLILKSKKIGGKEATVQENELGGLKISRANNCLF